MFTSLRSRLIASYVLIILLTLAIAAATLPLLLRGYQDQASWARLDDQLALSRRAVVDLWRQNLTAAEIIARLPEDAAGPDGRLLLLDGSGKVLADTGRFLTGQEIPQATRRRRPGTQHFYGEFRTPLGQRMLYVATFIFPGQTQRSPILAQITPSASLRAMADLGRRLLVAGGVALAVGLLLALLLARSISRPLARIRHATEELARGNLEHRLEVTGPAEVRDLAERFNDMANQVRSSRQAQRDFVANVSHDLKTPLTSIQGFSQALLDGTAADDRSRREAARIIHDESAHMNRLVEQLLELARWDAGQIGVRREPVALPSVLNTCVERVAWRATEKGITLNAEVDEGLPLLSADADRLVQAFTNLLDNGLTYTPSSGSITLEALPVEDGSAVEVRVTDTGPGIPAEELPRIFERFYRVDKARAASRRGAGLGLAIVKEFVEAHGGSVRAESVVGLGSRFIVRLPVSPDQHG